MNEDILDDIELLDLMLIDSNNQTSLYRPGPYWEGYCARITNAIRYYGLKNFRSNSLITNGYVEALPISPFDLPAPNSWKEKIKRKVAQSRILKRYLFYPYHWLFILKYVDSLIYQYQRYKNFYYEHKLASWYSKFSTLYNFPNTLVGNPNAFSKISINNEEIGSEYINAFIDVHNFSKVIDFSKINSVFEIGCGFGAFAHTLLHLYPNIKKYIYLDIPPILYVGTQYLKYFYGEKVRDYRQMRKLDRINFSTSDDREIIAICPWQIEKIEADIDFFWNSYSFQEMTSDILVNYMKNFKSILNKNSKIGLRTYTEVNSKTISPEDLKNTIQKNTSFNLDELKADISIKGDQPETALFEKDIYYFGYQKEY